MSAPTTNVTPNPNSAEYAAVVTPSDSTNLKSTRALYVGTAGNVAVEMTGDGQNVTFTSLLAGTVLPIRVNKVLSTGTTSSAIVALW